jgi:dihydrodipicolinate reductase
MEGSITLTKFRRGVVERETRTKFGSFERGFVTSRIAKIAGLQEVMAATDNEASSIKHTIKKQRKRVTIHTDTSM